ncbi:hypothetical protein, partial [Streptomyces pristinaespiralis]|uniref:hypothetical protein n=1 Tax=Streptomyces pristinaespiralis TaxID=38300 RepID=UPI001F2324E1
GGLGGRLVRVGRRSLLVRCPLRAEDLTERAGEVVGETDLLAVDDRDLAQEREFGRRGSRVGNRTG